MSDKAKKIVNLIIEDLRDRRGLKHEWNLIEDDIREEIISTWESIVNKVIDEK